MDLKNSETYKNLLTAFAGESQARNKYTYFSAAARKEGLLQVADFFEVLANNEKEHAKLWFKFLHGGSVGTTKNNLNEAIDGENSEWTSMYKEFAEVAEKEGFSEISQKFKLTAQAEKAHEGKLKKILYEMENNTLQKREDSVVWVCKNCGYVHYGKEPPESCPLCSHPKGYFKLDV